MDEKTGSDVMGLETIVRNAFRTGMLTCEQERQLIALAQHQLLSAEEWAIVDSLLEALIEGSLKAEASVSLSSLVDAA